MVLCVCVCVFYNFFVGDGALEMAYGEVGANGWYVLCQWKWRQLSREGNWSINCNWPIVVAWFLGTRRSVIRVAIQGQWMKVAKMPEISGFANLGRVLLSGERIMVCVTLEAPFSTTWNFCLFCEGFPFLWLFRSLKLFLTPSPSALQTLFLEEGGVEDG